MDCAACRLHLETSNMSESKYSVGNIVTVSIKHDTELSNTRYSNDGLPMFTSMSLVFMRGEHSGVIQKVNKTDFGFYYVVRVTLDKGLSLDVTVHEMHIEIGSP